jgi:hypothetical protein
LTLDTAAEARRILAERELERRACKKDLSLLLDRMSMVDEKTGDVFRFHLNNPKHAWYWQRVDVWDVLELERIILLYKARQLGITWLCAARQVARALTEPGTRHLVFRQREEDAIEIVDRQWELLKSLPPHLRFGAKVLTPNRGLERDDVEAAGEIELLHPDGRISSIKALPPTGSAGRGDTVASLLFDEAAFIDRLRKVLKATMATVGKTGEVYLVSTANGMSGEDGEGNYFHWLWKNADEARIKALFLGATKHPDRDEEWFGTAHEYLILDAQGRAAEYPRTPEEGFQLTGGANYFDRDGLAYYAKDAIKPLYRFAFHQVGPTAARKKRGANGLIRVYQEPNPDTTYAIAADIASGRGRDYSVAYVVDLSTMGLVAELRAKIDADLLATQLHFLGRWYGEASGCEEDAWIAVETAAGHGEAVIVPLRDGREGRPKYKRLYRRQRAAARPSVGRQRDYGFKINDSTRPRVLEQLKRAIRERLLPWMTSDLLQECGSFVNADTLPSPRAAVGCNDDCVLAAAIALELYREFGHNPGRARKTRRTHEIVQT